MNKDYYNINLNKIISYFESGIKKKGSENLGLEIEQFIVKKEDKTSVDYYEKNGIKDILLEISEFYDEKIILDNEIIGLKRKTSNITLEPAGQIEISIGQFSNLKDIKEEYEYFINAITPVLEKYDYELINKGYQPKSKIDQLRIIPKQRYEMMYEYFSLTGNHGKNMMKGSASTQVSIDYFSQDDFVKKFRLANILSPVFSLLTDNTDVFEGEKCEGFCKRVEIWNDTDKDRSMVVKNAINSEYFDFREYAKYILQNPAILIIDENGNNVYTKDKKIKDIYKDKEMSSEDIEHVLSMFFPDVRLKKYIEIRMADCMDIDYALSYASIVKGIFYNEETVNKFLERFEYITDKDVTKTKEEIIKKGYKGNLYGLDPTTLILELINYAKEWLLPKEKKYADLLLNLALQGKTLKDN